MAVLVAQFHFEANKNPGQDQPWLRYFKPKFS